MLRTGFDPSVGNKRDVYIQAIESYRARQLSEALALLDREGSPLGNVRSVVRFFESQAAEPPSSGCLVGHALVKMCPHDEEIAGLVRETLDRLREGLERALRDARARGELAEGKAPGSLALALTNAIFGLTLTGYRGTLCLLD